MDKDNMPMILTATKTLDQNANAADAAKRGAFWDLTEYLQDSEAYPNLSQISPDVLKGLTVDGQIIGIPAPAPSAATAWATAPTGPRPWASPRPQDGRGCL